MLDLPSLIQCFVDMYGWCQTSGDFTDKDDIELDVDNLLYNSKDWGFCTKECKLAGNGEAEFWAEGHFGRRTYSNLQYI